MKKLIVFIFLLCCVGVTALFKLETNPLFKIEGVEKVCFISNTEIDSECVDSVYCGDLVFNYCSLEDAWQNLSEFSQNIQGLQFYIVDVSVEDILSVLKASVVEEFEQEGLYVVTAYTPYYQDCVYVNGVKVNVQIASNDEGVIAGFPMILTGY